MNTTEKTWVARYWLILALIGLALLGSLMLIAANS